MQFAFGTMLHFLSDALLGKEILNGTRGLHQHRRRHDDGQAGLGTQRVDMQFFQQIHNVHCLNVLQTSMI